MVNKVFILSRIFYFVDKFLNFLFYFIFKFDIDGIVISGPLLLYSRISNCGDGEENILQY